MSLVEYLAFADILSYLAVGSELTDSLWPVVAGVCTLDDGEEGLDEVFDGLALGVPVLELKHLEVVLGRFQEGGHIPLVLLQEVILDTPENILLSLFHTLDCSTGGIGHDALDELIEQFQGKQVDFVVDPVGLVFVESLDYLVVLFEASFVVMVIEVSQGAFLEEATDPVAFGTVEEQSIALKDPIAKLSKVEVSVLE